MQMGKLDVVCIDQAYYSMHMQVAELITVCPAYIPSLDGSALLSNCMQQNSIGRYMWLNICKTVVGT